MAIIHKPNNSKILLDKQVGMQYNPVVIEIQNIVCLPRSSSGLGRRPFKAEIMGSSPIRGTI